MTAPSEGAHESSRRRFSMLVGQRASFQKRLAAIAPNGLTMPQIWTATGRIDRSALPLAPTSFGHENVLPTPLGMEGIQIG